MFITSLPPHTSQQIQGERRERTSERERERATGRERKFLTDLIKNKFDFFNKIFQYPFSIYFKNLMIIFM